jgi:hypothetical protein
MHAGTLAKPYVTHVTYAPSSMAPTDAARSIAHRTLVAFYVYRTYNLIRVGPRPGKGRGARAAFPR